MIAHHARGGGALLQRLTSACADETQIRRIWPSRADLRRVRSGRSLEEFEASTAPTAAHATTTIAAVEAASSSAVAVIFL